MLDVWYLNSKTILPFVAVFQPRGLLTNVAKYAYYPPAHSPLFQSYTP